MRGRLATVVVAGMALTAIAAAPASAAPQGVTAYDGSVPFHCTVQDVGTGTHFSHPDADPFCVRFDKTHQNVDKLGVVDFLTKEPARVAAAGDKCFYYQSDHWTGSVIQADGRTQVYNFEGRYWFDEARGAGGVFIRDFKVAGQSFDPRLIPGFPAEFRPYFGAGRGGAQYLGGGVPVVPRCVALARTKPVYRTPTATGFDRCRLSGGRIGRGIGGIGLGATRRRVRSVYGAPTSESRRTVRYCLDDGKTLNAGFRSGSAGSKLLAVKTDSHAFSTHGLGPGTSTRRARRIMRGERVIRRHDGAKVLVLRQRRRTLVALARRGRVRYVAVARPHLRMRALHRALLTAR